jgi:hypothetical protein
MFRRGCFGRQVLAVFGRASLARLMSEAPSVDVCSVSMPPRELEVALQRGEVGRVFSRHRWRRLFPAAAVSARFRLPRTRRTSVGSRQADGEAVPRLAACRGADRREKSGDRRAVSQRSRHSPARTAALAAFSQHPDGHRIHGPRRHSPAASGEVFSRIVELQVLKPPHPIPSFDVKQYWHRCQHADPGNRWLRGIIADQLTE